jgi:hypothetical protein
MGSMAVDTAVLVEKSPVHARLDEHVGDLFIVASLADLVSRILERKWILGARLPVALVALPLCDRIVNIVEEQRLGARAMRVMAQAASAVLHRVVVVLLPEGFVDLVTLDAKTGLCVEQKPGVLFREVGSVALEAVLLHRLVREFVALEPVAQLFVTLEAEGTSRADQDILVVGGVRVVALGALALREDLVDTAGVWPFHLLMTLVAERSGLSGKKHLAIGGVGIVTAGAVPLRQGGMQVASLHLLFKSVVTLDTEFGPRAPLQLQLPV